MTASITPDERAAMRARYPAGPIHESGLLAMGMRALDDVPRLLDALDTAEAEAKHYRAQRDEWFLMESGAREAAEAEVVLLRTRIRKARAQRDEARAEVAPSVVPEAAVEAAASAVRKERAFSAAAAFGVPMDDVPQCAEMIARTALTAALPFLTAAPSVTRDEVRDEIAGHLIGSGYYGTSVSVEEAAEIADALLARYNMTRKGDR